MSNIAEVLKPATPIPAPETNVPPTPEEPAPPPAAPEPDTCYKRCLSLLLQNFQQAVGTIHLPEIAKKLQLLPKQLEEWLQLAVAEGKLSKKKKKGRVIYVVTSTGAEQTLFDRDGDAA